jgi:hypothetical protein
MASSKANGKEKPRFKYRVLKRFEHSERLPDGRTLTRAHFPPEEGKLPKQIDPLKLGIPLTLMTDTGLSVVIAEVDFSGYVVLKERPSLDYITQECLAPATQEERAALEDYLRRRCPRLVSHPMLN